MARYMTDSEAKRAIIDIGQRMYQRGFVAANDGNITCRVSEDLLWTTPTGVSKGFMDPDSLVKVDLSGKVISGNGKPSSELKMHLRVYKENPEIMGVTHAHPPISTAYAVAGLSLETPVLTEGVLNLGVVPVARYALPGTEEVPDSIAPFVNTHNAVLLANHGVLSWGRDVYEAFYRLESVENYAKILMYTGNIIQKQNVLSCDQVQTLVDSRARYGITSGGIPPCCPKATNTEDVITNIVLPENIDTSNIPGITPLVRPAQGNSPHAIVCDGENCSCSSCCSMASSNQKEVQPTQKDMVIDKDAIVREVTNRLMEKLGR